MRVRRRWVERDPASRRHLARPVISVGNLSMGGTGKTPVVSAIAQWLVEQGQRPSILSRGYGREEDLDGVVVVSDGEAIRAPIQQAGDEPMMLARQVPGAAICVSPDRHLAGTLAEERLGCTVHVLDDGFQHIELARDLDVLVTTMGEIPNGRVIPMGRLREPMDAAARANVLVVSGATAGAALAEAWTLGISQACGAQRTLAAPVEIRRDAHLVGTQTQTVGTTTNPVGKVLAVAGIANPETFGELLAQHQWVVTDLLAFADHHRYTPADVTKIAAKVKDTGADAVFTTDKDAVRFDALGPLPFDLHRVPLVLAFDPADVLFGSIRAVL